MGRLCLVRKPYLHIGTVARNVGYFGCFANDRMSRVHVQSLLKAEAKCGQPKRMLPKTIHTRVSVEQATGTMKVTQGQGRHNDSI